jgi:prepilin-type N-terminal cleavage/methylation domain-containing protein
MFTTETKIIANQHKMQEGFSLVELSIVLVIIGLIVGGTLAGKDLIKGAEIRATVGQFEKYNTAVNTFRSKYGAIPGDLTGADNFGFQSRSGAAGHGDNNGLLEGCAAAATNLGCETALFWRDLSTANLIDTSLNTATDAASASLAAADMIDYMPLAKLGRGNYFNVYAASGINYYQLAGTASTDAAGIVTTSNALTPSEAFQIDNKIDDGKPATGIIRAMEGTTLNDEAAAGAATCVFTGGAAYNSTSTTLADSLLCQIRVQFN